VDIATIVGTTLVLIHYTTMKFILVLFITLPLIAMAQDGNATLRESSDFDIAKHQWKHRVLLLFTEDIKSEAYTQQLSELNKNTEALKERKLITIPSHLIIFN